jgi:methylmalonyl-CoA/ethylmalonyl-CoA epimerase
MPDTRVEFRRFHHVTIAVDDLDAAVADWTDRLGWPPSARSTESATFPLDDSFIELVSAGNGSPGVMSVSVVVDDVEEAADRLRANGVSFALSPEGHATLNPAAVNGVPMELRPDDADSGVADPASRGRGAPYRRFNHIIVAVSDDEAASTSWAGLFGAWTEQPGHTVEAVHHVPVGIGWFGLTGSGTDATALTRFLERRGEGIYGLALVVDDHPATIAALEKRGAQIIRQESSGQTFVHPKTSHGLLIDLVPERHPSRV